MRTVFMYLFLLSIFLNFNVLSQKLPAWLGDTNQIKIDSNGVLHSQGIAATNKIHLYQTLSSEKIRFWELSVFLDFDLSTSNYMQVYLITDSVQNALNGYILKLNGSTNSIDLLYQQGEKYSTLIKGSAQKIASKTATLVKIKVIYNSASQWYLYSDTSQSFQRPELEGSCTHQMIDTPRYTMIDLFHTSTRRDKFHILHYLSEPIDSYPEKISRPSAHLVSIKFTSPIKETSPYTFLPDSAILYPYIESDSTEIFFSLPPNLQSAQCLSIRTSQIYHPRYWGDFPICFAEQPELHDIVFSELMIDPIPSAGLEEYEYIEIYNRSSKKISSSQFQIKDEKTTLILPEYSLPEQSYILICPKGTCSFYPNAAHCIEASNWISLNNTGDVVEIKSGNQLIDKVAYTDRWYKNELKKDGGYSLEKINKDEFCLQNANWSASEASEGGSPGMPNSVSHLQTESPAFSLVSAQKVRANEIQVLFSLPIFSWEKSNFKINSAHSPDSVVAVSDECFNLIFATLPTDEIIEVRVNDIKTCKHDYYTSDNIAVVSPSKVEPNDILLNEILFNPHDGGYDFIELYNRSNKVISLEELCLVRLKNGIIDQQYCRTIPHILMPKSYLALTENKYDILSTYTESPEKNIIELPAIPDMNDDEGHIQIRDTGDVLIDEFIYSEKLHHPVLQKKEGVSLEKINNTIPSGEIRNWQSAAAQVNYASPGYQNSQTLLSSGEKMIQIVPDIVSNEYEHENKYANILLHLPEPGYIVSIDIVSRFGKTIRTICRNTLCGTASSYSWNGMDSDTKNCVPDIYFAKIQLFHPNGSSKILYEKIYVY